MADKLATLIRLHRWRLDEQRRLLGQALHRLAAAEDRAQALQQEIAAEQQRAADDPQTAGFAYAAWARAAIVRRDDAARAVSAATAAAAGQRTALEAAWRSPRTFELADESRCQRRDAEAAGRERAMLDEVAVIAYTRADADAALQRDAAPADGI